MHEKWDWHLRRVNRFATTRYWQWVQRDPLVVGLDPYHWGDSSGREGPNCSHVGGCLSMCYGAAILPLTCASLPILCVYVYEPTQVIDLNMALLQAGCVVTTDNCSVGARKHTHSYSRRWRRSAKR